LVSAPHDLHTWQLVCDNEVDYVTHFIREDAMPDEGQKKPEWITPAIQSFRDGISQEEGQSVTAWVHDAQLILGSLTQNCKEYRHDDPDFREWYTEIRNAASDVSVALDKLKEVVEKYSNS
jgi:hypothetical protein